MTDDDNVTPIRSDRAIVTAGGPVDTLRVSLALYGEDLDPTEVSGILRCEPSSSHRRGEIRIGKKTGHKTVYKQGAWFLSAEGRPPRTADEITNEVLVNVPSDDGVWSTLALRFDIQMRYGLFLEAWNRGFGLSSAVVERIAHIRASLEFDIYANLEDSSDR